MVTAATTTNLLTLDWENQKVNNYSLIQIEKVIWDPKNTIELKVPTDMRRSMAFQLYQTS